MFLSVLHVNQAPKWFTDALPTDGATLDGELFTGRGEFNTTTSIVRSSADARWGDVTYLVFDMPSMATEPFEDRMAALVARFGGQGCVAAPKKGKKGKKSGLIDTGSLLKLDGKLGHVKVPLLCNSDVLPSRNAWKF